MSEESPLVSLIVPAYNAEKYIAQTIRSVIDQTLTAWELIIVNDGSTDSTPEAVAAFDDSRIKVIEQPNSGVSAARNTGLDEARGKYITFLDADDVLPPHSLQSRVAFLETRDDVGLVDGRIVVKDMDLDKTIRLYQPYYSGRLLPRLLALDSRVFFNVCYMFRRDILGEIRFKAKMSHAEDLLFYIRLGDAHAVNYGFVDEPVYWYRSGHTSAMANLDGLEQGYLKLLGEVDRMSAVSYRQKCLMHLKVTRIMVLSRLKRHEIMIALRSLVLFLGPIGRH